jgi:hypothetical protein
MAFHQHTPKTFVSRENENETVTFCVTCWEKLPDKETLPENN